MERYSGNHILDVTGDKVAEDSRQAGALEIKITPEDVEVLVDAYYLHRFGEWEGDIDATRALFAAILAEWLQSSQSASVLHRTKWQQTQQHL